MSSDARDAWLAGESVRDSLAGLRSVIEEEIPPSRERSLVLTKIQEAELWLPLAAPSPSTLARRDL